jgi:hypothetical protein
MPYQSCECQSACKLTPGGPSLSCERFFTVCCQMRRRCALPTRAIESRTVSSPNPVARVSRTGVSAFSIRVFCIKTEEISVPAFSFCFRVCQHRFPCATACGSLAARAARAIRFASSIVLMRRQSCVGITRQSPPCEKVSMKWFDTRCSVLPPRPCTVIRMNPSASASRIAGATEVRCIPYCTKSSVVTGNLPLSLPRGEQAQFRCVILPCVPKRTVCDRLATPAFRSDVVTIVR